VLRSYCFASLFPFCCTDGSQEFCCSGLVQETCVCYRLMANLILAQSTPRGLLLDAKAVRRLLPRQILHLDLLELDSVKGRAQSFY